MRVVVVNGEERLDVGNAIRTDGWKRDLEWTGGMFERVARRDQLHT